MGVVYKYRSLNAVDLPTVQDILDKAARIFDQFKGMNPENSIEIEVFPSTVTAFTDIAEVTLLAPGLTGQLSPAPDVFEQFERFFVATETLSGGAILSATIGFDPTGIEEDPEKFDTLSIWRRGKGVELVFSARGTGLSDLDVRRQQLRALCSIEGMPLKVTEVNGSLKLRACNGATYKVKQGTRDGCDPESVACLFGDASTAQVLSLARAALVVLGSLDSIRDASWSVADNPIPAMLGLPSAAATGRRLLEQVGKLDLPAEGYRLSAKAKIAGLTAFDGLRGLCGPEDEITAELATGRCNEIQVGLDLRTNATGHRIEMEAQEPIDIVSLAKAFDLEFKEIWFV